MDQDFWEKISFWKKCPETLQKQCFLDFAKKIVRSYVDFLGFNHALKPHLWEKSGSRVKYKNAVGQSDCSVFKL